MVCFCFLYGMFRVYVGCQISEGVLRGCRGDLRRGIEQACGSMYEGQREHVIVIKEEVRSDDRLEQRDRIRGGVWHKL